MFMRAYKPVPVYNRKDIPLLLFIVFFTVMIFIAVRTSAQKYQLAVFTGIANYQGDLKPVVFTFAQARPAVQIAGKIALSKHWILRAGYTQAGIYADDKFNRTYLQPRNLNFRTNLSEVHAGLEYNFFDLEQRRFTPYIFIGAGIYQYNPYTYDNGEKVYLQPMGTEGQGLTQYPERKFYRLQQYCIPIGYGVKYKINCMLAVSVEFSQRKLFTDYFDDVSSSYADPALIAAAHGAQAARLSWRGNQFPGGNPNAPVGTVRGNPKENDWYYFLGTTLHVNLQNCNTGKFLLGSIFKSKRSFKNSMVRCPRVTI
jgi:hypothetical protein